MHIMYVRTYEKYTWLPVQCRCASVVGGEGWGEADREGGCGGLWGKGRERVGGEEERGKGRGSTGTSRARAGLAIVRLPRTRARASAYGGGASETEDDRCTRRSAQSDAPRRAFRSGRADDMPPSFRALGNRTRTPPNDTL